MKKEKLPKPEKKASKSRGNLKIQREEPSSVQEPGSARAHLAESRRVFFDHVIALNLGEENGGRIVAESLTAEVVNQELAVVADRKKACHLLRIIETKHLTVVGPCCVVFEARRSERDHPRRHVRKVEVEAVRAVPPRALGRVGADTPGDE